MKKSLQCPKCDGRKIWHIEKMLERSDVRAGRTPVEPLALSVKFSAWRGFKAQGSIEMFACAKCGFAELYADTSDLVPTEELGVRLLDNEGDGELR